MARRFDGNEAGVFFTAMIVLALASWPVSFTLGAYGEVFYTSALTIWIASLAALFAGIIIGKTGDDEEYFTWWGSCLFTYSNPFADERLFGARRPCSWYRFSTGHPFVIARCRLHPI